MHAVELELNVPGVVRYQGVASGVGTDPVQITVADSGAAPPRQGKVHRVKITWTGPATKVALSIREGVAGAVRASWSLQAAPFDRVLQPFPLDYELGDGDDLVFEAYTDDGTDASILTVVPEIEGVA